MSPGAMPRSATSAWSPSITPVAGSVRTVGDLNPVSCPVSSFSRLKSVNVPPMSMPSRYRGTTTSPEPRTWRDGECGTEAAYRGASRRSTARRRERRVLELIPGVGGVPPRRLRRRPSLAPEDQREQQDSENDGEEPPSGRRSLRIRARVPAAGFLARRVELELGAVRALPDHGPQRLVGCRLGLGPLERHRQRGLRRNRQRERAAVRQGLAVDPVSEPDDGAALVADPERVHAAVRPAVLEGGAERPALAVDREGDEVSAARGHGAPSRG